MKDIPFWTGFIYTNKDFLSVAIPKTKFSNCKNICCQHWRRCITQAECTLVQNFWEPIRDQLAQENISKYDLVTLDCYFYPPNLLDVGVVASVGENKVQIWYLSGKVLNVRKDLVFKFPTSCRVSQLRPFIIKKHKRILKLRKARYNLRNNLKKPEFIVIG